MNTTLLTRRAVPACGVTLAVLLSGCATTPATPVAAPADVDARSLPMYDGRSGDAIGWDAFMALVADADVIVLGEQHNDAVAHALQLAVTEDVVERWPGSAVSFEMLERDEQLLVDDYMEGVIDAEQFAELTFSSRWAGPGSWTHWYQPIIDAAKEQDSPVVAANAPRRYVRLARTDGYERLESLDAPRRSFVEMPHEQPTGPYRDRFWEVMGGHDTGSEQETTEEEAAAVEERIKSMYRSQLVWDATMADSVAAAFLAGAPKVVHLVGQFHSDFDGGLVLELRRRLPGRRIMVISMQAAADPDGLRSDDVDRADVVAYTR